MISEAFTRKSSPPRDGTWFSHYLAPARNGILIEPETARLPFMSCRRRCDIWTVSGGGVWRGGPGVVMESGVACDTLLSRFLQAYRMSFKICQLRQPRGRYPKWFIRYRLSSCNSHALHNKQFQLDTFYTQGGVKSQSRLHRCHKVMRALQLHRLNYILKGRAVGGSGDIQVFTAR